MDFDQQHYEVSLRDFQKKDSKGDYVFSEKILINEWIKDIHISIEARCAACNTLSLRDLSV